MTVVRELLKDRDISRFSDDLIVKSCIEILAILEGKEKDEAPGSASESAGNDIESRQRK